MYFMKGQCHGAAPLWFYFEKGDTWLVAWLFFYEHYFGIGSTKPRTVYGTRFSVVILQCPAAPIFGVTSNLKNQSSLLNTHIFFDQREKR